MNHRTLLAASVLAIVALGACGDDDTTTGADPSGSTAETTAAPDTTEAPEETTTPETVAPDAAGADADVQAAGDAVATVFDSSIPFDDKVALIEDGESYRTDHEEYVAIADSVGGVTIAVADVAVDGDTATVTYGIAFAGSEVYSDLTMTVVKVDGAWVVPTDSFCGLLASAQAPCA